MVQFSLVLVHNPFCQDIGDFETIAALVRASHPEIEVFIVGNDRTDRGSGAAVHP